MRRQANPLVGFTREGWARLPSPSRAEATFRSTSYEGMWRSALARTGIKFRVYVGYPWKGMPEFIKRMRAIDRAAKKAGEVVLLVGMTPQYLAEARSTGKRGERNRISRPTPFMLLHNLAEDIILHEFGYGYDLPTVDLRRVDTWAGRHGVLDDELNAVSDLFAKYVTTGVVAYGGPNEGKVRKVIMDVLAHLHAHPGIYAVTFTHGDLAEPYATSAPMSEGDFEMVEEM